MKRAWMVSLLALGISTSAICAEPVKPAGKAAAQVKDDAEEPESKLDRHIEDLTLALNLSKSQKESVRKTLEEGREKRKALRKEMNEKRREIKEETEAKLGALLKPDQKKKFLELQGAKSEGRRAPQDATDK